MTHHAELPPAVFLMGPTAAGKTALAVDLCQRFGMEIISVDSALVYRGLDIGSGKDLEEYGEVPYHLIDIIDPGYEFNLFEYQKAFQVAFNDVRDRKRCPFLVGGSAMYIDAVINDYQLLPVSPDHSLRNEWRLY
jgi:tRNA dimethylallyltransferase